MRSCSILRSLGCGAAVLLGFSCNWSVAQVTKPPAVGAEQSKESVSASGQLWEVDIAEGNLRRHDGKSVPATIATVVSYLRDLHPTNVVLAPGVSGIKIADLKLASFRWETALEALRVASGDAFVWMRAPESRGIDPATGQPAPADDDLFVLTPNENALASRSKRVVEVFNMSGYVRGQNPDKVNENLNRIIEAVSETLAQLHEGSPETSAGPRFKYHDTSSLFIVIGSPEEVEVARKIVLALPETSTSKEPTGPAGMGMDEFRRRYGLRPEPQPANNAPPAAAPAGPRR